MRNLKHEAFARRYDFDRMSTKDGIIYGHYRLATGWSKTPLAHVDDMNIFVTASGCRQMRHQGRVIYTFGPKKGV